MEFFEVIKGVRIGRKLAKTVCGLSHDVVNKIHMEGEQGLKDEDAYEILKYCFCPCWMLTLSRTCESSLTTGAALEHALDSLSDWYLDVSQMRGKVKDLNAFKSDFASDFKKTSLTWRNELRSSHPELMGKAIEEWLPAIGSELIIEICSSHPEFKTSYLGPFIAQRFAAASAKLL